MTIAGFLGYSVLIFSRAREILLSMEEKKMRKIQRDTEVY